MVHGNGFWKNFPPTMGFQMSTPSSGIHVFTFYYSSFIFLSFERYTITPFSLSCFVVLRYLTYVMDVATPTSDCLHLVHDLLTPVIMKGNDKATLSHQEVSYILFSLCPFLVLCESLSQVKPRIRFNSKVSLYTLIINT